MPNRSGTISAFHISLLLVSVALVLALPFAATAAAQKTVPQKNIAPHKALYNIEMISRRSNSSVLNISGQMYFEWQKNCDAWTTDHRFKLSYEYADSPPMNITSDFSTYELFDGKGLDFSSRRHRNGELYEELRGHAVINEGGNGEANYSTPSSLRFDLPAGTLFPVAHTQGLLRHIRDNKTFYKATVFDGSDEEGPVEINSFISKKEAAVTVKQTAHIDMELLKTPARHVRMAFFPLLQYETGADYEMNATLHRNGVISHMVIEYHDFSIEQKLVALEKLTANTCPD